MPNGHPELKNGLDLNVYLHVICCDHCTGLWGDERIAAYGQTLLTMAVIGTIGNTN